MHVQSPAKPEERLQTGLAKGGSTHLSSIEPGRETEPSAPRLLDPITGLAGALSVALGTGVLLGWHFGAPFLLQVRSGFTAMAYNTAVCFALLGLAFVAIASGRWTLARLVSAAAGLIALGRLFQYVVGIPYDFETILSQFTLAHPPLAAAPMAPNTAIGLALIAVAVWLSSNASRFHVRATAMAFCGSAAAALGLNSFIGYATGLPTYLWGHFKPMAVHTSVGLIILGLAAVVLSWCDARKNPRSWMVVVIGMAGAITSISLWQALSLVESQHLESTMRDRSALPETVLIFGLLVSALLGMAVYLAQTARLRSSAAERLRANAEREVAERKAVQQELQRASAYNRSLIEASLDPLVTIAPNGKITDVNRATEQVTGCSRQELIGTDFSDYFTEPERARDGYQQVFREGLVQDYELAVRRRDGHVTPVLYNASVYRDEAGAVAGVFAAARDITERKRAEEELGRANAYNRSLIEASLDPLVTIAPDGKITDVNRATEHLTGCSRQELIGTDFCDYFTEPQKARDGYQQVFREGLVQDYELAVRRRDGHVTPVLYNASVYRDETGAVVGVFAAARDITERKRGEQELRLSRERLALAQKAGHSGTFDWDIRNNVNIWTPEIEALYGLAAGTFGGRYEDWEPLVYPDDLPQAQSSLQNSLKSGEFAAEWRIRRASDGEIRWLAGRAKVFFDGQGRPERMIGINTDITERKRAEEALEQKAQDLARSNADLEQFAYVASHDLQEPLRMVANFTQLLADRYRDQLGKDGAEFIAYAVDGARRMQRLIQDLLTYSRVGTRGKAFELSDSNEALGAAIANLQIAIQETDALVSHDELPTVMADASQLAQLFQNLVGNAIKFRGAAPPRVHVSAVRQSSQWRFSVRDNGIGIDPEFGDRIFVIFQRLHSRDDYPGTGIGLALCKKIVERHRGKIWVESEPGKGATFFFTIPTA